MHCSLGLRPEGPSKDLEGEYDDFLEFRFVWLGGIGRLRVHSGSYIFSGVAGLWV